MPIYAYKCASCGFAKDVLQKMSDPVLTVCPQCGQARFAKQLTAAGFQLKGSGWYVTDFRDGGKSGGAAKDKPAPSGDGAPKPDGGTAPATSAPSAAPQAAVPAPAPAAGNGGACCASSGS